MSEYYQTNVENAVDIKNMRKFHNYVKFNVYGRYIKSNETNILELAGGRGGDLFKLQSLQTNYILFIDIDENALNEAKRRYNELIKNKPFTIDFLQLDITKVGTLKEIQTISKVSMFNVISIQFAIHYFLSNETTFNRVLKTIDSLMETNGHVIITALDGAKIFGLLKDIKKDETYSFSKNGKDVIRIQKDYSNNRLNNLGQQITFFIESIGQHPEYLVNFDYLIKKFEKINYSIVEDKYFYQFLKKWHDKTKLSLSDNEKAYSILNRLIVFKKN